MTFHPVSNEEVELLVASRVKTVQSLAEFREDWQKIFKDQSLIDAQTSIGLLLADIANRLDLTDQEKLIVVGRKLASQIDDFLEQKIRL